MMDNYEPRMVVGTKYKKLPNPDCGNCWGKWIPKSIPWRTPPSASS